MREIKFRGKRDDNGEWVYGCFAEFVNYLDGDTKPGIQVTNQVPSGFDRMIPAFETELVEVIPETVGQYTGLYDKNGVEIYEGDIITTDLERPYLIVEYRNGAFMINCNDGSDDYYDIFFRTSEEPTEVWKYGEIIGNIYENPELMV